MSVPRSMRVDITCFWHPLHPTPQSCLPPALPSRGEGVGGVMCSVAAVSHSLCHSALARGRRRGNNWAGGPRGLVLPSLRTPSLGAPLAL